MTEYLTPATIARLAKMEVVARMVVEGALSGHHLSPQFGFNIEFAEHRSYQQGDELRHIDWKHFGKTDEYFVKQYEESTSLRSYILLDCSRSMAFGDGPLTKHAYARYLAAAMGYLMIHQQDSVGLATFTDGLETVVAPRSNPAHLHRLLETLEADPAREKTDSFAVFRDLAAHLKRRHLVVVISDFLDDPEQILRGVRFLRSMNHDLVLLQVLSPEEIELPYEGLVRFRDLEEGEAMTVDASMIRSRYQQAVSEFLGELTHGARALKVDLELFCTDRPIEETLGRYLARRVKKGRA